jgi:hypothetical protein
MPLDGCQLRCYVACMIVHVLTRFRIYHADGHTTDVDAYDPQHAGRRAMRLHACAVVGYERLRVSA